MTGVLLINLGTPDAPNPDAVGRYLREFLMDGYVIDVPAPLRWFLVNVVIVPRRKHQSAAAYQKIQLPEGSPLLIHTRALTDSVGRALGQDYLVEFGMRYGNPSIGSALEKLKSAGVSKVIVLPLYPQYAESSFETAVVETRRCAREMGWVEGLIFLPPFSVESGFISAWTAQVREHVNPETTDHIVFSFHGVPVRHVARLHPEHCLQSAHCCATVGAANKNCYRAQCFATARAVAAALELHPDDYSVGFQSRLGRAEWIGPNTTDVLTALAQRGAQRVAVACPSFVADCLETIEEIGIRGRQTFIDAGGTELTLIPSLNSSPAWVHAIAAQVRSA